MPSRLRSHLSDSSEANSFVTIKNDKQFSQQYANLYWLRLVVLRKRVLERAKKKWEEGNLTGKYRSLFSQAI